MDAEVVSAVVSDVRLPDGSGLDIASQAQQNSIAFGMVTGDVSYIGVFSKSGIHFIMKPFSFQEFKVFMAELISRVA